MIGDFHFIRPWWLLAIVPLAALVWALRRRGDASQAWAGVIAPHLLAHLLRGETRRSRVSPLMILSVAWLLAAITIAGPTWLREPAPFADDTAAVAIVVKVTPSMLTEDVAPSRLARSVQKIHDLLQQRRGAKTALIAYAGSAHRVMPVTTDGGIIDTFAGALDPKLMPIDGDAPADALKLADEAIRSTGGSIVWIADSVAAEQDAALAAWRKTSTTPVRVLAPLLPGSEQQSLSNAASLVDAEVVAIAPDDADVSALARAAKFSPVRGDQQGDRWQESGYWLTPVLAALSLPFFRKGWMVSSDGRG